MHDNNFNTSKSSNIEVIESLYGIDIDPRSAFLTAALIDPKGLCEKTNIYCADTLNKYPKELKNVKFDIVVGNPPYQSDEDTKAKGNKIKANKQKLWPLFVKISIELLDKGGYMALIHPTSWMNGAADIQKGRVKIMTDYFAKYKMTYCTIKSDIGQTFNKDVFKVGSTFCWYILHKIEGDGIITIQTDVGPQKVDLNNVTALSPNLNPIHESIHDKVLWNPPKEVCVWPKLKIESAGGNEKGESKEMSDYNKYTAWAVGGTRDKEIKKVYYPYKVGGTNIRKVIINAGLGRVFKPYIDDEGIGMANSQMHAYEILPNERVEYVEQVWYSKLFRFLVQANDISGFVAGFIMKGFPKLDCTRSWTDQEIYEYFNLTKEEIELIENTVKD